jgi:hypothetical protein
MLAATLHEQATGFTAHLRSIGSSTAVQCEYHAAEDIFIRVYDRIVPSDAGVYWFHLPDSDIFYIGSASNFRERVWNHINAPRFIKEGLRGLPNCRFGNDDRLPEADRERIRRGEFRLDYLVVQPATLAPVYEAYLQGVCILADGHLPACNSKVC